jgi:deazaflavin-dependent oxidoreductase (nitroreductase family)
MWFMNKIANPFVRFILRSPLHGLFSAALLLISYRGRKSGRAYTLPVNYVRDGNMLYIVPGMPEQKTWWRNLRGGAPVELILEGKSVNGTALLLEGQPEVAAHALTQYLKRFPPSAKLHGVHFQADGSCVPEDVWKAAQSLILVRVMVDQA